MLRAIIIDDELIGINMLKGMIEKYNPEVKLVASTTEPQNGIDLIENYKPDLVFLDISMPEMNGFDLLAKVKYKDFKLVFTTAHNEYAIKAIKNKAQDYLLKPIDLEELRTCITSILAVGNQQLAPPPPNFIELAVKNGIVFMKPRDIIRVEGSGSYTVFHLNNNVKQMVSKNLKECEALLEHPYFFRCHISHIINLHHVVKLISNNGFCIQMSDGSLPELSRKNKELLLEKLKTV
ncbi:MAG TPA: LytTR family DNA-binding domain-containing protein [Bacteroidia bacterium]|nr:LytTR family DNA-binding domain-containing protein [Bacteroidia bacterium]